MRADLSLLSPLTHPRAFVNAAVLSPDDPAMDASDAALGLMEAEIVRCSKDWTNRRMYDRRRRVERAILNLMMLRKAKR